MITIASLVQAFSIFVACWTINAGVGAWRREFIGKRQIELAEQALASFFEVKDAIIYIRNPFLMKSEGSSREHQENESIEEARILDRGYVSIERYALKEKVFSDFNIVKYRYMAAFGSDKEDIFTSIAIELNKIFNAAHTLATIYWKRGNQEFALSQGNDQYMKDMRHFEEIIWSINPENNEIGKVLQAAQERMEAVAKSCSQEPMDSYRWLTKPWSLPKSLSKG